MTYFTSLKNDFPASLAVFFVALPLCLGVALASGAPLASGLLAGIIGGIVVGSISGSHTSVSGPAAGMVAVVLVALTQVGSFQAFTMALTIAGIIQMLGGFMKVGIIASYIPKNIIQGLLVAIGLILILKQIPHAVGLDQNFEGDFSFFQKDGENTFTEIWKSISYFSPGAIVISMVSMAFLIIWSNTSLEKKIKFFPPSFLIVLVGIGINELFIAFVPEWVIGAEHLVNIPSLSGSEDFIVTPDFSQILSPKVWYVAFTIAIVATLETLINIEATDNLDPQKNLTPPNRELFAQGIGNTLSGLIGGIPITSVVVRSSVNIHSGAKSKTSTILHGSWLLIGLVALPGVLNKIPFASLAAILIMAGYKLAKIKVFVRMYERGWSQFIPFIVTVVSIVLSDLLTGIIIGSGVSIFYLLKSNLENPFLVVEEKKHIGDTIRITLPNQVSFLNKARIKKLLRHIPENEKVIIEASHAHFVDSDVIEIFREFVTSTAPAKGIKVNVLGFKGLSPGLNHIEFSGAMDKTIQDNLDPHEILDLLSSGNRRFAEGKPSHKFLHHQVAATSDTQSPMAVVLSCVDSRTSPDLILDAGIGDLISIRIAGNIISSEIAGSVELATQKLGVKLVVILGHSNCGAVSQSVNNNQQGNFKSIFQEIKPSIAKIQSEGFDLQVSNPELINQVAMLNLRNSVARIKEFSPILSAQVQNGEIGLVAGFYDTNTGLVTFDQLEYLGQMKPQKSEKEKAFVQ